MVEPLKTGEILVKEGLIRLDDIDMALSIQEKRQASLGLKKGRLFGMILCDLNLITPVDNYYVLHKYDKFLSIQSALVSKQIISKETVLKMEKESSALNLPFISLILKTGLVSTSEMQKLLFDLFHIPFRSISDFVFNERDRQELCQVLDKHLSLENRIIPMVLKDNTILFGITDPENILFIHKLNDHCPQYRFKALFIPFSGFSWFYKIIYNGRKEKAPSDEKPVDLSLLLSFKTSIRDPEQENEAIRTLYDRYELLRQLIGNPKRENLQNEFNAFILQSHKKITRDYKSHGITFSLKREDQDVKVVAFPKT
ncbi:MAG: hypothetical protein KKE44_09730 [Proteobacteria bacterium]|nr:hypothetical protein [Pseudomonadota bacterium]MBU1583003.1 hypothetical protein [Pseudomonadota bacterium]MBU2453691.1 hypothetical protein [Pseudomonadota bacterium]MBU2628409.1 hypothetical protein [Pseudomonadota bacterium]